MSGLGLGLGLGLGAHRIVDRYGNKPATFTISAGFANAGVKYINFSEPVTVTITGDVTLSIGSTPYQSGATIPVVTGSYPFHELTINNPGAEAGTITFGKRKQITYLLLQSLGLRAITGDITGMKLTILDIRNLGSSVITGKITGMNLTYLYLNSIGSSLSYGTNLLNITSVYGIQLLGNTVFATDAEYEQLFIDAAASTWSHSTKRPFTITGSGKNFHRDYYDWGTFSATPGASSPTPSAIAIKSLVKRGTNPVVVTLEGISAYSYAGGFPENFENWWAE